MINLSINLIYARRIVLKQNSIKKKYHISICIFFCTYCALHSEVKINTEEQIRAPRPHSPTSPQPVLIAAALSAVRDLNLRNLTVTGRLSLQNSSFVLQSSDGTITILAPEVLTDSYTITLPPGQGSAGQVLAQSSTPGILIWQSGTIGSVTAVTGTPPITSTGGNTPAIGIPIANASTTGALSATDYQRFNTSSNLTVAATSSNVPNTLALRDTYGDIAFEKISIGTPNSATTLMSQTSLQVQQIVTSATAISGLLLDNTYVRVHVFPASEFAAGAASSGLYILNLRNSDKSKSDATAAAIGLMNRPSATILQASTINSAIGANISNIYTNSTFYSMNADQQTAATVAITAALPGATLNNSLIFCLIQPGPALPTDQTDIGNLQAFIVG